MKPLPVDGPFDSAALSFVLHCLRGPIENKGNAIKNIADVLAPDGVLFGGTVLGIEEQHSTLARAFLRAANKERGFDNLGDTAAGIRQILSKSFLEVQMEIVGSAALGYLVGLLLAGWSAHVTESGEMLILLAGSILFCVGVSRALNLSPLVTSLAVGATMVNLADRSRHLFGALSHTDPPFYAIFFVIAGAELDVSRIPAMGLLGVVYIVGRASGKFAGARFAAWRLGLEPSVRNFLGFALQAQAGLAVGLTLAVNSRYPQFAPVVTTIVLASVAVFEMIGPASTRFALVRAGEAGLARQPAPAPLSADL